ncbi:MAG: hypothetical protein AAFU73_02240 [Planctomycetota bacterium]
MRYLKVHEARRKFDQEVAAYESFAGPLGASPRLVARSVRAECGGYRLLFDDGGQWARPGAQRDRAAGALLARLHRLPVVDDDPVPLDEAIALRARAAAEGSAELVEDRVRDAVVARAEAPWPEGIPRARRVACHRDYAPYNWLTRAEPAGDGSAELVLIDWEHARLDTGAADLDRALGSPGVDAAAFLQGYGPPSAALAEELARWTPIAALARIRWARDHGDQVLERAGRERIASWFDDAR